jgi:alkylated DNA repair dioxygenase AlkB
MISHRRISFQPELFAAETTSFDSSYAKIERIALDTFSWVDRAQGWIDGADALFQKIIASRNWKQRSRWMYSRLRAEPRLTAPWRLGSGVPLEPSLLEEMRGSLSLRYSVLFDSVGFNLYRDGQDSVAWHRDHIRQEIAEPIVALVILGERRKLMFRPRRGGASRAFLLGHGDLLVTGGRTNLDWEHAVPKTATAGPRISLAFRYGMDARTYQ